MSARKNETYYDKKALEFRRNNRRQELDSMFSTIRKDLMKREKEQSASKLNQDVINEKVKQLYQNSPEYFDALDSLWKDCLQKQKIKLFSSQNISKLCLQLMRLKHSGNLAEFLCNSMMMLIWIIGNWCFYFRQLPLQLGQMIPHLIDLLTQNSNPKLNHLIIYLFTNTCCSQMVRVKMMKANAVRSIIRCSVFENKQTDISTFLCNFICNMPFTYKITQECKDYIIQFLKKTEQQSKTDKDLRIDSILIVSKMLIINNGAFHSDIICQLANSLTIYIEKLDNVIREETIQDILEMLTNLYKERNQEPSQIYSEEMYNFVWKAVQGELNKGYQELGQRVDTIKNKMWDFLYQFCQIQSPTIDYILQYLYKQCISKEIGDYEQRAVKILVKNYHNYDEQAYYFWVDELIELHSDEDLCKDLLKIIKKCLINARNSSYLLSSSQSLRDLLNRLIFSEQPEISQLSSSIIHFHDKKPKDPCNEMEQEKENTKSTNKSFRTVCEVLSTPLFINSNPFSRDSAQTFIQM